MTSRCLRRGGGSYSTSAAPEVFLTENRSSDTKAMTSGFPWVNELHSDCVEGTTALWYGYGSPLNGNSLLSFSLTIQGDGEAVGSRPKLPALGYWETEAGFCNHWSRLWSLQYNKLKRWKRIYQAIPFPIQHEAAHLSATPCVYSALGSPVSEVWFFKLLLLFYSTSLI